MNGGNLQKMNLKNMSSERDTCLHHSRLLGSYNGQLYVHPALPGMGVGRIPLLTTSPEGPPMITADSMVEFSLVKYNTVPSTDGGSEVSVYGHSDYQHWITHGPAGVCI